MFSKSEFKEKTDSMNSNFENKFTYADKDIYVVVQPKYNPFLED